jgi:putative SOS response-associated peptidase YedK
LCARARAPAKLRAFADGAAADSVLVLVDADDDACDALRAAIDRAAATCAPNLRVIARIAVEEVEAFYPGDLRGLKQAFPAANMKLAAKYVRLSRRGGRSVPHRRFSEIVIQLAIPRHVAAPSPARYLFPMCGRTTLTTPLEALRVHFGLKEVPEDLAPQYNGAPTQLVAAIRRPGKLERLRFGLVPPFARHPREGSRFINARSETVAKLAVYRDAFRERRCLVVVDGFFEWLTDGKRKLPHLIRLRSGEPFAFAGVWGCWVSRDGEVVESVSILTAPAEGVVAALHDRMPVVLAPDAYGTWLEPGPAPEALLKPARIEELVTQPVSSAVNSPQNDSPACLAPPEAAEQASLFRPA